MILRIDGKKGSFEKMYYLSKRRKRVKKGGGGERKKEIWHGTRDVGTRHPSPLQHLKRFQRLRFSPEIKYFNIVHEDDK